MTVKIIHGDCLDVIAKMESESVHCVVTSPPYWGLRDYSSDPLIWGSDGNCEHDWGVEVSLGRRSPRTDAVEIIGSSDGAVGRGPRTSTPNSAFCNRCNSWRGSLGLEPTPELYVEHIVEVFREVRRVIRKDGTLWLNMGDSYASNPKKGGSGPNAKQGAHTHYGRPFRADSGRAYGIVDERGQRNRNGVPNSHGLKEKDLVMMPARTALALQADGWWLRSDIIWAKPNPMPESVQDRPTSAHEHIFLLTPSAWYFYDAAAVRTPSIHAITKMPDGWDTEPGSHGTIHRNGREKGVRIDKQRGHSRRHAGFNDRWDKMERTEQIAGGANLRNVWTIATQPYPQAHFATFPIKLVEPCIKAGCPKGGTVLDPFGGSGTVGLVAERLGRNSILIELNAEYADMARARIRADLGTVETDLPETHDPGPLFKGWEK